MRVDRVVDDGPGDPSHVEGHAGRPVAGPVDGGPAQQRAPVEGQSQDELRPVGEALHEGVADDQAHGAGAEQDRVPVQLEKDHQAEAELTAQKDCRVQHGELPGREGAVPGSGHLSVDVPVPHVVDSAARAAHDEGARAKEE